MNRRYFIKVFSAGASWFASTSWTGIVDAKPVINTLELKQSTETDILDDDEHILKPGKEVFVITFYCHLGILSEIVYKLNDDYYFRSEHAECYGYGGNDDFFLMHVDGSDEFVDGPYDSLKHVFENWEMYEIGSAIKSIKCTEMTSEELASSMPSPDYDFTVLINGEIWGYDEDEEHVCLELVAKT